MHFRRGCEQVFHVCCSLKEGILGGLRVSVGTIWRFETTSASPPPPQAVRHKTDEWDKVPSKGPGQGDSMRWKRSFPSVLTRDTAVTWVRDEESERLLRREKEDEKGSLSGG